MNKEDMKDNLDWLRECKMFNYTPIKTKLTGKNDLVIALKNDDPKDDSIYEIDLESDDELKRVKKKKKTFREIIDRSVLKFNIDNRVKHTNKIRLTEFTIEGKIEDVFSEFEEAKIKQLTNWANRYNPVNPLGAKIAQFELFEKVILLIEKDEEGTEYRFEMEEPILLDKTESLIQKIEVLLNKSDLEFEKIESDIIENE